MEKQIAADKAREAGAVRITTTKPFDNQPTILYGSTFGYDPYIALSGMRPYIRRCVDIIPSGLTYKEFAAIDDLVGKNNKFNWDLWSQWDEKILQTRRPELYDAQEKP